MPKQSREQKQSRRRTPPCSSLRPLCQLHQPLSCGNVARRHPPFLQLGDRQRVCRHPRLRRGNVDAKPLAHTLHDLVALCPHAQVGLLVVGCGLQVADDRLRCLEREVRDVAQAHARPHHDAQVGFAAVFGRLIPVRVVEVLAEVDVRVLRADVRVRRPHQPARCEPALAVRARGCPLSRTPRVGGWCAAAAPRARADCVVVHVDACVTDVIVALKVVSAAGAPLHVDVAVQAAQLLVPPEPRLAEDAVQVRRHHEPGLTRGDHLGHRHVAVRGLCVRHGHLRRSLLRLLPPLLQQLGELGRVRLRAARRRLQLPDAAFGPSATGPTVVRDARAGGDSGAGEEDCVAALAHVLCKRVQLLLDGGGAVEVLGNALGVNSRSHVRAVSVAEV
eukprot:Rhum_TRINITY_DN10772_c0_g2::Rhum_TRINITY_DN10772_c0_g2_i1::g.40179::m.40179